MSEELYRRYRPARWADMIGQESAVNILRGFIGVKKLPHAILLSGPAGCGKTTLARLVRVKYGCSDSDCEERNCADLRGIDPVRDIIQRCGLSPMVKGSPKFWILDEVGLLTREAMSALLKPLEEPPSHVYFILCTTDPSKLLKTIISRCTEVKVSPICLSDLKTLVLKIWDLEAKASRNEKVASRIAEVADGSARKALELLNRVLQIKGEESQLQAVLSDSVKQASESIARLLLDRKTSWKQLIPVLKGIDSDEAESTRQQVLGYASAVMLNPASDHTRAYLLIEAFGQNYYTTGKAGLIASCYYVTTQR